MKNKLIRVERTINTYSNLGNTLLSEINIDHIPFDAIKEIVLQHEDDPLLYDGYVLSNSEIGKINFFLNDKIAPNFELYFYVLEAAGIYE